MPVYLLRHVHHAESADGTVDHLLDGEVRCDEQEDDVKLLGVYSTETLARERIERARRFPGFAEEPDCFMIAEYEVDRDHWAEGFVSVPYDEDE